MEKPINPGIFKAYDIRGVYPTELNEEIAYKIGQSFANYAKSESIIVGRDTRLSSPSLAENLIKGIADQGVNVIDIGLCSTSCFYYTVGESEYSGIMVTASHASKENNGFKMVFGKNVPLTKEQILELKKIVMGEQSPISGTKGSITEEDPTNNYVQVVKNSIKEKIKPLKVVMDAGNGMAGLYIEKVFSGLGINIVPIFTELDGNFPNHETNPKLPENREKLKEKVIAEKADLGFMFDGDADRVCVIDRNGKLLDYSLLMAILAEYRVKNSSKKKVVIETRTSTIVHDWVGKVGGSVMVSECWTIPIKLKMQNDPDVIIGGETSGHYVFPELHEADDGIMSALTFLQAISVKEEPIDGIIEDFRKKYFVMDETNFEMPNMQKADEVIGRLREKYSKEGAEILEVDGLSVIFKDWWFNLRKSQSEPVIRLNFEANKKELYDEKKEEIISEIKSSI
ncbi:MAG TPA: phosphomannomutase/phosphoglucomutase [Candidatus Moranbacteria bacterium]|nr:phosphomannomutase/phosphoglucomutase [Candidatus Moranbacteria bacterium]